LAGGAAKEELLKLRLESFKLAPELLLEFGRELFRRLDMLELIRVVLVRFAIELLAWQLAMMIQLKKRTKACI